MRDDYTIIQKRTHDIYLLSHPEYGQQMWTIVKVRKHKACVVTGIDQYKKHAWSPITNGYNRMDRISIEGMRIIERQKSQ